MKNALGMKGFFVVEHIRGGKTIAKEEIKNAATNVGLNLMLDAMFTGATAISSWYMGLIDNANYSAVANDDTMASHAGWQESVAYSESARPAWGVGAAGSQSVTNATAVDFTINASAVIKGIFVTSDSTKSASTGTLWATSIFSSARTVNSGDVLKLTYTVTASRA